MARKSWREISADVRSDPERAARIAEETRPILDASALARLRESRSLTQAALAEAMQVSQARISHIERQDDFYLSTLIEYVRCMGGELRISVVFPDETVELVESRD